MKSPAKVNVNNIFDGSVIYRAPVFQRYYVWGQDQLDSLLTDISDIESIEETQFLGAVVLQEMGKTDGVIGSMEYLIIDGQQRLTTLFLIMAATAKAFRENGCYKDSEGIVSSYLTRDAGGQKGIPKVVPTTQDRKQFYDVLKEAAPEVEWDFSTYPVDEKSAPTKLKLQWRRIDKWINDEFKPSKRLRVKSLRGFINKLLKGLDFVEITLDKGDDANVVFTKLNFEGTPLALSDLVRNDVFSRFSSGESNKANRFYEQKWHPFETSFPGDSFDKYIPIYSYIKFHGKIPKSRAFPELQESWSNKTAKRVLDDLSLYSPYFQSLWSYKPISGLSKGLNECVRRFSIMPKTSVTWPFIIRVLYEAGNGGLSNGKAKKTLEIVESFLVRRAVVGMEPTGLHAVFKSLWEKTKGDPKLVVEKIQTTTIHCPVDEDVLKVVAEERLDKRQILKYLLTRLEEDYVNDNKFDSTTANMTYEHVLPRNLTPEWRRVFTREEHSLLVGKVGNLVPLTKGQNSSFKDSSWDKKRKMMRGSNWKITQHVARKSRWTPQTIKRRTTDIGNWIVGNWKALE